MSGTSINRTNVNFMAYLEYKKQANHQRRLQYYGLQYFDYMVACKTQNEKARREYYGLNSIGSNAADFTLFGDSLWMQQCKKSNQLQRQRYYGLDSKDHGTTSATSSTLECCKPEDLDFEQLCRELEEFMKQDWAKAMEEESIKQWESEQKKNKI